MELLGDLRIFGDRVKQLVARVLRVARHEAEPELARQLRDLGQQIGKIDAAVEILAIGVHVLPQQRDVLVARGDQRVYLFQDLIRPARPFAAPHVGHDAVGAEIVAAVHDRHPRLEVGCAHDRETFGNIARRVVGREDALVVRKHEL